MAEEKIIRVYKPYKLKRYATKQLEIANEVGYLGNDLFLSDEFYPFLNRWVLSNKLIATVDLPIRYSVGKGRYEMLKGTTYTKDGYKKTLERAGEFEKFLTFPTEGFEIYFGSFTVVASQQELSFKLLNIIGYLRIDGIVNIRDFVEVKGEIVINGSLNIGEGW